LACLTSGGESPQANPKHDDHHGPGHHHRIVHTSGLDKRDCQSAAVLSSVRRDRQKHVVVMLSLINYGECVYVVEREQGLQQAQRAVGILDQLAVHIVPVDRPLVFEAAHLKARYAISYADAFGAALAQRNGGCVMTGDPEFRAVEPDIAVHWLPDRRK
jgi:predicted nucleic acid-binding protein